jgi:hypothetical protein
MDNLLPRFPFDLEEKKDEKTRQWNSLKAYPDDKSLSTNSLYYDKKNENKPTYTVFKPILGPNQRYDRTPVYNDSNNLSPLCYSEAGHTDIGKIILPQSLIDTINEKEHKKFTKSTNYLNTFNVFVSFENYHLTSLDIFIKIASQIQHITLLSNRKCTKFIAGHRKASISSVCNDNCVFLLTAPANKVIINMTGRQEIKCFNFKPGPIGMVVEIINERLTCVKVIEESQASAYQTDLDQAEIVSVNNQRIHTLEEFQNAVFLAQLHGNVIIQAKVFIGGRKKVDDLYAADFYKKRANVKNLFSNILQSGFDKDHQHGIELPAVDSSDEEENDNDEEESKNEESNIQNDKVNDIDDNFDNNKIVINGVDDDDNSFLAVKHERRVDRESIDVDETMMEVNVLHINNEIEEEKVYNVKEVKQEEDNKDDNNNWDYATSLEHAQILPYTRLICVPNIFLGSSGWDNPKKLFHISNFSPVWDISLYWIDEDCALIPRGVIKAGSKHVELISSSHIWTVIATSNENLKKKYDDSENDSTVVTHDGINTSNVVLIIRPSLSSIQNGKCTNLLWLPNRSITLTQTTFPSPKPDHKRNYQMYQINESELPNFHLQIIDSPKDSNMDGSLTSRSSKQQSRTQSRQKSREKDN